MPQLSEEIGRGILRVRRLIMHEADRRLAARGESILSLQVLGCLSRLGPLSQGELAQSAGQHPTGMSRLLDELEQARLVRRGRDRSDRRRVMVEATARGLSHLAEHQPLVQEAFDEVLAPLLPGERRVLRDLLRRMLEK